MLTNAFYEIGFNCIYVACKVELGNLQQVVEGIKAMNILGANVTIPHKVEIMKFLDEIDPIAKDIGAINTIVNKNGHLYATNTDGTGAVRSLKEAGLDLKGLNVVMIGSGGVSRAIAFYLLKEIDHLHLTDINEAAALKLKMDLVTRYGSKVSTFKSDHESMKEIIKKADFLINCTPIGMYPKVNETPIPKTFLRSDLSVFDVVYNPLKTRLIKDAESLGAKTISGFKMFLYQGVEGFELWTGKKAPVELMESIIIDELNKKK